MKLGDKMTLRPSVNVTDGHSAGREWPCTVVYIHPEQRFFTVEFRSEVTGQTFREAFPYPGRPGVIGETPIVDPDQKRRQFGPASLRQGGVYDKTKG